MRIPIPIQKASKIIPPRIANPLKLSLISTHLGVIVRLKQLHDCWTNASQKTYEFDLKAELS
jgi:hypothetical protein